MFSFDEKKVDALHLKKQIYILFFFIFFNYTIDEAVEGFLKSRQCPRLAHTISIICQSESRLFIFFYVQKINLKKKKGKHVAQEF